VLVLADLFHRLAHFLNLHAVTVIARWYRPGHPGWIGPSEATQAGDQIILFNRCVTCGREEKLGGPA